MIWVAEIGSAHNGSKAQAFEMIRQAKLAGATIAKFQFGWTREAQEKYAGNYNEIRFVDDWAYDLAEWCEYFDIELMASIWSYEGLEAARAVDMKRYKLAHQFVMPPELGIEIGKDDKVIFASTTGELFVGVKNIYCPGEYPTYPPVRMPEHFDYYFGYSSHVHGIADALLAAARGARYVEKHVTLNKADTSLRDNAFALSFDEFAEMVRIGDEIVRIR